MVNEFALSISLIISFFILTGTIILFFRSLHGRKRFADSSLRLMKPLNLLIAGVFPALFVIFFSYNCKNGHNPMDSLLVACFNVVRVFLANEDISFLHEAVTSELPYAAAPCTIYISFLYILAPVLLLGFVLSFLEDATAGIKFVFLAKRNLYVFSGINERSVLLAEDIKRNPAHKKDLVVFCNVLDKNADSVYEYARRAEIAGALCLKKSIEEVHVSIKNGKRKVCFILLDEDEAGNLKSAIALVEKYRDRLPVDIYTASTKTEAEIMLDSIPKGEIEGKEVRVRRIHETRNMVYRLIDERPLFLNVRHKKISVLIVGAGNVGFEALKAVSWCGRVEGYGLEITVVDREADAVRKRFAKQCPGIFREDPGNKAAEDWLFFAAADVCQDDFIKVLEAHKDVNYVIVALGSEDLNIRTAVDIRTFYMNERLDENAISANTVCPLINVVVDNPYTSSLAYNLKNVQDMNYNLLPFGDIQALYKEESVLDSYYEKLALSVHYAYGSSLKAFNNSEYNRKSSMSAAVHLKYRLYSLLGDLENTDWTQKPSMDILRLFKAGLTRQKLEKLSVLEHERWNAYMRTEGFVCAGREEVEKYYPVVGRHYHVMARKHPCLVEWDGLDRVSEYVSVLKGRKVDFKADDRDIVSKLPAIYEKTYLT
jgi:hypothetical protein